MAKARARQAGRQRSAGEKHLYRLKPGVGKHTEGAHRVDDEGTVISRARTYRSNDPLNNIVESAERLDLTMPEKFEAYLGPRPEHLDYEDDPWALQAEKEDPDSPLYEPRPPGPTTDADRAEALAVSAQRSMTPDQMEEQAKRLEAQAKELRQASAQAKRNQQEAQQRRGQRRNQPATDEGEEEEEGQGPAASSQTVEEGEEGEEGDEQEEENLEGMTREELRQVASRRGVTLNTSMTKAEIVEAIRAGEGS